MVYDNYYEYLEDYGESYSYHPHRCEDCPFTRVCSYTKADCQHYLGVYDS